MRRIGAAYVAVLLAVATGCGNGGGGATGRDATPFADQPPARIIGTAFAAMRNVTSVHVTGTSLSGQGPVTIEVVTDAEGDCLGTLTIAMTTAQIMTSHGHAWIKPDLAFWSAELGQGAATVNRVGQRWVVYKADTALAQLCDLRRMLSDFHPARKKGGPTSVSHDDVYAVSALKLVSRSKGHIFTTWVETAPPHRILKIDVSDDAGGSLVALTFTSFDKPFHVRPPRPSQVARVQGISTGPGKSA